jgi:hypothetical protein
MNVFSEYQLILNNGVNIQLDVIYQYKTYLSVLTGNPTRSQNQRLIEKSINYAKEKLWCCENPYLINPIETKEDILHNDESYPNKNQQHLRLPFVTCCATFSSPNKGPDNTGDYSEIHVVWFQDNFALPINDNVLSEICAIDWNRSAIPCYF